MAMLITGSSGTIGKQILNSLAGSGVEVRAFSRSPDKAQLPSHITPVQGDLANPDSVREALKGVSTLFLLIANVADELTQAMQAVTLAREAGVKGLVYLSVLRSAEYSDVPHFASKHTVERMLQALDMPATILQPAYFMQNDARQRDPLTKFSTYAMPIGSRGVSMVDVRDIGEAAASEMLRRERAAAPEPRETYALVGPDGLTGASLASIWSEVLGRPIRYGGDDLVAMEARFKAMLPPWLALDLRLMMARYQSDGAVATQPQISRFTKLLGHAPRSYREFAVSTAESWR